MNTATETATHAGTQYTAAVNEIQAILECASLYSESHIAKSIFWLLFRGQQINTFGRADNWIVPGTAGCAELIHQIAIAASGAAEVPCYELFDRAVAVVDCVWQVWYERPAGKCG